jgi:hypothetical protein
VVINARVWTAEPGEAEASAVAVSGDRIIAVGSVEEVNRYIGGETRIIDAKGRRVIPGLVDCHTHIINGGLQLSRLHLREVPDRDSFIDRVADAVKGAGAGQWVVGGRWSVESWADPTQPTKAWIDPVSPQHAVYLTRMDGHQALANSVALRIAGIDADGPPDPVGGQIDRDPDTNEPTGILRDAAMGLVSIHTPELNEQQRGRALLDAMRHANRYGVTAVHDMCEPADLASFEQVRSAGMCSVRIQAFVSCDPWSGAYSTVEGFANDKWVTVGGFKGYMDGSLGSRTAFMHENYADAEPGDKYPAGLLAAAADPPEKMAQAVERADAEGFQLAVHAIGDRANTLILDFFEKAALRNGPRDRRHRVEHAQHLTSKDVRRFFPLGVYASMQPYHKADDGRYAEEALGAERIKTSYAFRDLLDSGAWLCFGSDWPVVTLNPFAGIASAVNARTLDGKAWVAEQSISVEEALQAYTLTAAAAGQAENLYGSIQSGKLADMVILDRDPFAIDPTDLENVGVDLTIVGGRVVWDASAAEGSAVMDGE